jgi:hypothetical protein
MNRHTVILSGILAAALTLTLAHPAAADPPPWAGVWRNGKQCRDGGDLRGGRFRASGYDPCSVLINRIRYDRSLIAQWQGTGRHEKVVRWAHEDIAKAQRELSDCRSQARYDAANYGYDPYYQQPPRYYDPYSAAPYGSDPYYGGGFEWKRDWPLLLGSMINGQIGR